MTDAPKIDTQAPDTIWAIRTGVEGAVEVGAWADTVRYHGDGTEYIRADLSAAREAAAVERAFRDGLTYGTICEVTDQDAAWRTSQARERLGDPAALDRLIAEAELRGMRNAVAICKKVRNEADSEDEAVGALDCALRIMDEVNARSSKEGRDATDR